MTPYEQFRRLVRDLNLQAQADLRAIWRSAGGRVELAEVLAELVQSYGDASAAVAAEWYDTLRSDSGVGAGFRAVVPDPRNPGTAPLIDWAASKAQSEEAFRTLISGGIQRRITNYSRNVITTSAVRDPKSGGWMRTGTGECGFCAMLISRGAVYSKETVDFASHDHCECHVAPVWSPAQVSAVKSEFVPTARRRSDRAAEADRERAKRWIAANL